MPDSTLDNFPQDAKISHLEPLASDPNLRRIKVEGKMVARLPAAEVAAMGLEVGQKWTESLARAVQTALATEKARKAALNLLGRRGFSRAELVQRLVRKGHDRDAAGTAADEMVADGWIDEEEYARSVARAALSRRPAGHRLLVQKMTARRIDRDLADRVAAEALEDVDLNEAATDLAERRLRSMGDLPPAVARRRIAGTLTRRGFDSDIIRATLDRLAASFDDANDDE